MLLPTSIYDLDDDVMLAILDNLAAPDLISMRKVSRRYHRVMRSRVIWLRASRRCAFPVPLSLFNDPDLPQREIEQLCHRAHSLSVFWNEEYRHLREANARHILNSSIVLSQARIVPGSNGKRIITLEKGIWCSIACWEIPSGDATAVLIAKLTFQGSVEGDMIANDTGEQRALVAVSVVDSGSRRIEVLALVRVQESYHWSIIRQVDSKLSPFALSRSFLVYGDHIANVTLCDVNTGKSVYLRGTSPPSHDQQIRNLCLQVLFWDSYIIISREHATDAFLLTSAFSQDFEDGSDLTAAETLAGDSELKQDRVLVPYTASHHQIATLSQPPLFSRLGHLSRFRSSTWWDQQHLLAIQPLTSDGMCSTSTDGRIIARSANQPAHPRFLVPLTGPAGTLLYLRAPKPDVPAVDHGLVADSVAAAAVAAGAGATDIGAGIVTEELVAHLLPGTPLGGLADELPGKAQVLWGNPGRPTFIMDYDETSGTIVLGSVADGLILLRLNVKQH